MNATVKGYVAQSVNRAEAVPLESDHWICTVIFTIAAIAALSVIALFSIAAG